MHSAIECLTLLSLRDLAISPYTTGHYSSLSKQTFVLVDLRLQPLILSQHERDLIAVWVQRQSCPVIAIADEDCDILLTHVFDVIAADETDAQLLIRGIEHAPIAAMTLVQVLRTTATMPAQQALLVESLAYSTLQAGPEFKRWLQTRAPAAAPTPSTCHDTPLLIEREDSTLYLTLNRPERRNAISVEMRDTLVEALQLAIADTSITEVSLRGKGACFSIGGDLDEFGSTPDPATAHAIRSQRIPASLLVQCAERLHFHVHSACIGAGMEIPAFGSKVTAARNAFFQLPEIRFGLIPGAGGCISLPRRIGRQRTAYLALSAKKINATTALAWGLVDSLSN